MLKNIKIDIKTITIISLSLVIIGVIFFYNSKNINLLEENYTKDREEIKARIESLNAIRDSIETEINILEKTNSEIEKGYDIIVKKNDSIESLIKEQTITIDRYKGHYNDNLNMIKGLRKRLNVMKSETKLKEGDELIEGLKNKFNKP